jgi:hypothetical protein
MPAPGELLRRDVYPAEILMPDGSMLTGVRVFVTTHRLLAYQVQNRTIKRVVDLELVEPESVPLDRQTLGRGRLECRVYVPCIDEVREEDEQVIAEGNMVVGTAWVNQGRGCGCGSPLKALKAPCGWTV